jgi:hypothetical protein
VRCAHEPIAVERQPNSEIIGVDDDCRKRWLLQGDLATSFNLGLVTFHIHFDKDWILGVNNIIEFLHLKITRRSIRTLCDTVRRILPHRKSHSSRRGPGGRVDDIDAIVYGVDLDIPLE